MIIGHRKGLISFWILEKVNKTDGLLKSTHQASTIFSDVFGHRLDKSVFCNKAILLNKATNIFNCSLSQLTKTKDESIITGIALSSDQTRIILTSKCGVFSFE